MASLRFDVSVTGGASAIKLLGEYIWQDAASLPGALPSHASPQTQPSDVLGFGEVLLTVVVEVATKTVLEQLATWVVSWAKRWWHSDRRATIVLLVRVGEQVRLLELRGDEPVGAVLKRAEQLRHELVLMVQ